MLIWFFHSCSWASWTWTRDIACEVDHLTYDPTDWEGIKRFYCIHFNLYLENAYTGVISIRNSSSYEMGNLRNSGSMKFSGRNSSVNETRTLGITEVSNISKSRISHPAIHCWWILEILLKQACIVWFKCKGLFMLHFWNRCSIGSFNFVLLNCAE